MSASDAGPGEAGSTASSSGGGSGRQLRLKRLATAIAVAGAGAAAVYAAARVARPREAPSFEPDPDLEMPSGLTEQQVETSDGASIHIVAGGPKGPRTSGPPPTTVVLLHGAGLSSSVWAYQFRDLMDSHRLVALDLRAHGESEPGSGGTTIALMADDLARVLERLDLHRIVLVGHSMGGMVALRFARRHPEAMAARVASLLLVSTAGGVVPATGPWASLGPFVSRGAVSLDAALNPSGQFGLPEGRAGTMVSRVGFGERPTAAQLKATLDMLRATQPTRFVGLIPEIMSFDERATYSDLHTPVTVLVGDRDRFTPPGLARQLAQSLPGAQLLVWRGGGHMLMYERREAFDQLLDSLARAAASGLKRA